MAKPIHSAGGVVVRKGARPVLAVVRRSKDGRWVLPRGKLKRKERALAGARREAVEETGHKVSVHGYIGAIVYPSQGRPKLVQFWHMRAARHPSRDLMPDISQVAWLPLSQAVKRLSSPLEKLFLQNVGRELLPKRKPAGKRKGSKKGRRKGRSRR
jgi:8-oxo-dGTP diphosphatase